MHITTASVQPGHALPTQENLDALLEKLVSIFEVESVLKSKTLPAYPLQREGKSLAATRVIPKPISGNDFHIWPSFSLTPSWEGLLQLESGSDKTCLPLCNIEQHPNPVQKAIEAVQQAVELLRTSWPDATIGPSKRRQLGPDIYHPDAPGNQLFAWIASKDLNPVCEGVFLNDLILSKGLLHHPLRYRPRGLAAKPEPESEQQPLKVSAPSGCDDMLAYRPPDAQIWSFTGPDPWVISLPVLSAILLLMANPNWSAHVEADMDSPDRDLSWCLDSLHGFCRRKGPEEIDRNLSWTFGTYPDSWMYLHFVFHHFGPHDDKFGLDDPAWKGNGIRCDRRTMALPIGSGGNTEIFRERRVWLGMRTATPYPGEKTDQRPGTVGFVLSDWAHHRFNATENQWLKSGLESPKAASGIALFQLLLWQGIDEWSASWHLCLNYIDGLHEVKLEVLEKQDSPALRTFMWDSSRELAYDYFLTAHLLKVFRKHIDAMPESLRHAQKTWEITYPGRNSDLQGRFDESTQTKLLDNWASVIAHAEEMHAKLITRIEKRTKELLRLRDSLFLARIAGCTGVAWGL